MHDEPDPDWLLQDAVLESLGLVAERQLVFEIPAVFPRHLVLIPRLARQLPHLKIVIARRDTFDRGVRRVLQEGMAAGTFARNDAKLLAFAIFGSVNWIPRWFNPHGAASSDEIANRFADYLIAGLRR